MSTSSSMGSSIGTSPQGIPRAPASDILKPNSLTGLPTEILMTILDHLPYDDTMCFSFCNHRLYAVFQTQKNLPLPTTQDKLSVLTRLSRDLPPKYFICHVCYLFHKYDNTKDFGLSGPINHRTCTLPCWLQEKWDKRALRLRTHNTMWMYSYYDFSFLHLQLAMRGALYGPSAGLSTESIAYTQVRHHPEEEPEPDITSLFSVDARVYSNPDSKPAGLCLRMQDIMLVKGKHIYFSVTFLRGQIVKDPPGVLSICAHKLYNHLAKLVDPMVESYHKGHNPEPTTGTCEQCNTDFQINIRPCGNDSAVVITRWIDLGSGISPDDFQWKVHSELLLSSGCIEYVVKGDPKPGSPRTRFEAGSEDHSVKALLERNFSYLEGHRYKQVMGQSVKYRAIWHLPFDPGMAMTDPLTRQTNVVSFEKFYNRIREIRRREADAWASS